MLRLGVLLLIVPVLVLMGLYFWELNDVRACTLEGGYWNYIDGECREEPQPYISWLERSPWLVNGGMLLSVVGLVMCMAGLNRRRR